MSKKNPTDQSEEIQEEQPLEVVEPDYKELYQRSLAEQDNLRKRLDQEKQQFIKFARTDSIESLLPIVDNFYRATDHVPDDQKDSAWLTGILYIQKQLISTLEGWGVEEIPAKPGDVLDPSLHEAIGTVDNSDIPEDHIVSIQNRGYRLNGRVIRPVAVTTSKPLHSSNEK